MKQVIQRFFGPQKGTKFSSQRTTCIYAYMHLFAKEILAQYIQQVAKGLCLVQPEAEDTCIHMRQCNSAQRLAAER